MTSWPPPSLPGLAARAATRARKLSDGIIRVGVGGWTFAPWRGAFYPDGLPHAQELAFSAERLTSIEINATFYGAQKPASFEKWRDATPEDFVFSVKGPRGAGQHKEAEAVRASIARFIDSGVTLLGGKLGPILWQFAPTRHFDAGLVAMFLDQLPPKHDGVTLRHAIEARHASFADPAYIALLRQAGVAQVIIDSDKQALYGDITGDFVYCRLQRNAGSEPDGYAAKALDAWAARAKAWSSGKLVDDLPVLVNPAKQQPRDCFLYCISGDKVRAPDAAMGLLKRLT